MCIYALTDMLFFPHRECLHCYFPGQLLPHFLVPLCNKTPGKSGFWFLTFHSLKLTCQAQHPLLLNAVVSPHLTWSDVALDKLNTPPSVRPASLPLSLPPEMLSLSSLGLQDTEVCFWFPHILLAISASSHWSLNSWNALGLRLGELPGQTSPLSCSCAYLICKLICQALQM